MGKCLGHFWCFLIFFDNVWTNWDNFGKFLEHFGDFWKLLGNVWKMLGNFCFFLLENFGKFAKIQEFQEHPKTYIFVFFS